MQISIHAQRGSFDVHSTNIDSFVAEQYVGDMTYFRSLDGQVTEEVLVQLQGAARALPRR
jgi:hypothetical protein